MPRVGRANFLGALALLIGAAARNETVASGLEEPGRGVLAFSSGVGDGKQAREAPIGRPEDIAVDSLSRVFLADPIHARVRVVDVDGTIRTLAGTGEPGTKRWGELATETELSDPAGLAVAEDGTLFVADRGAHRIYALFPSGTLEPVPLKLADGWRGLNGPTSIAVDDDADLLFVAEAGNQRLLRIHLATGEVAILGSDGPADDTVRWQRPERIAYSPADKSLWVLDDFGHRLTQLSPEGKLLDRWPLSLPAHGIAVDERGTLYPSVGARVRRKPAGSSPELLAGCGQLGSVGDGGPAVAAKLWGPTALRVSVSGEVFILDPAASFVRKVDAAGQIHTVAGNGSLGWLGDGLPANESTYHCADVVESGDGRLYVADSLNHRVAEIDLTGSCEALPAPGCPAFQGMVGQPTEPSLSIPRV